ncbi:uncharacterized protein LOC120342649 isoform X1 [Styela clava]
MSSTTAHDIQYMQTGREDSVGTEMKPLNDESTQNFSQIIDPPRKPVATGRKYSFESSDDDILTSDDDADYHLSSTTSSDDETIASGGLSSSTDLTVNKNLTNIASSTNKNDDVINKSSLLKLPSTPRNQLQQKSNPTRSSFMDVVNEIYDETTDIPAQNRLGPKPWLMRRTLLPKPKGNYQVSDIDFGFRPKQQQTVKATPKQEPKSSVNQPTIPDTVTKLTPVTKPDSAPAPSTNQQPSQTIDEPLYSVPTSRGRISSGSTGNVISDNEKPTKYPSETDTGFVSNASSNPSPSNSSQNISRLPSSDEVSKDDFYKIAFVNPSVQTSPSYSTRSISRLPSSDEKSLVADKKNAQELARAAIQALSLSKNILQDMEKEKDKVDPRDPDTIYDEVALSPMTSDKRNVYDDVPAHDDVNRKDNKRTVISVPVFKPPPPPTRNDKNNVISSEPIYDITRQAPRNVSSGAVDLMYQLFGKDMTGYNQTNTHYGRPASVKSVTFEDDIKPPDDGFPSRPSSRAGSVYSEWSDCTINLPEAPESEASTLPRNTAVDFPTYPQIGFSNLPPNNQMPNLPHQTPQQFPPQYPPTQNPPYRLQDPSRFPPNYPQVPNQYPNPNGAYNPRNPMFPQQGTFSPPQGPFTPTQGPYPPNSVYGSTANPSIRSPIYGSRNPYQAMDPHMGPYSRPPQHAFSPPRHWGGFSPPQHQRHHHEHFHKRGRTHTRGGGRRRGRRSRRPRYSDDEDFSRSPSPLRHQYRDVINAEKIAGKSYLDGYKAALKDAVITFAERQGLKQITNTADHKEDRIHGRLRRAISAGRIHELPDNVELGDIRKAFAVKQEKSYSDDDIDDVIGNFDDVLGHPDDFIIPSSGRPHSRNGSPQRNKRRRHQRYYRDDDVIDDDFSGSEHGESCDCSECEEEFEIAARFHEGEMMTSRPRHSNEQGRGRVTNDNPRSSPRMQGLRQRYMESLESSASTARAPVRASQDDPRDGSQGFQPHDNRRMRQNHEVVQPNMQGPRFRNDPHNSNFHGPPMTSYNQRGGYRAAPPMDWNRRKRVQFGYQ